MQQVILVDEHDNATGTMEKMEVHRKSLLHRAFSVFIFNSKGAMLLQQRAANKYHSGGLWTNACCSHPSPGEDVENAAVRRLKEELGFTTSLTKNFSFIYHVGFDNGLTEHEFDHVFSGVYSGEIPFDRTEVQDVCYLKMEEIEAALTTHPQKFTEWFKIAFPLVKNSSHPV